MTVQFKPVQLLISLTVVLSLYPVYYLFDPYNIMESSMLEWAHLAHLAHLASQPGLTDVGQTSALPQSDAELSYTQVRHTICIPKHSNSIQGLKNAISSCPSSNLIQVPINQVPLPLFTAGDQCPR